MSTTEMDSQQKLPSTGMPELPEVYVDGHKVADSGKQAISELYELINMANIARMRKNSDDEVPEGWVMSYDRVVTPAGEIVELNRIGQAITFINDGPAAVRLGINSSSFLQTVNALEPFNLHFRHHKLSWFYVRCAPGLTAAVRISVSG